MGRGSPDGHGDSSSLRRHGAPRPQGVWALAEPERVGWIAQSRTKRRLESSPTPSRGSAGLPEIRHWLPGDAVGKDGVNTVKSSGGQPFVERCFRVESKRRRMDSRCRCQPFDRNVVCILDRSTRDHRVPKFLLLVRMKSFQILTKQGKIDLWPSHVPVLRIHSVLHSNSSSHTTTTTIMTPPPFPEPAVPLIPQTGCSRSC